MICDKLSDCIDQVEKNQGCVREDVCVKFYDDRSKPSCNEKGKSYSIINPERKYKVLSLHMDGGVITEDKQTPSNFSKCDYLFVFKDPKQPTAFLIELKGKSTSDAIDQISHTLEIFRDELQGCKRVYGRIVNTSSIPNIKNNPDFIELYKDLKKLHGDLKTHERILEENYAEI
jgi:hypothetical protein